MQCSWASQRRPRHAWTASKTKAKETHHSIHRCRKGYYAAATVLLAEWNLCSLQRHRLQEPGRLPLHDFLPVLSAMSLVPSESISRPRDPSLAMIHLDDRMQPTGHIAAAGWRTSASFQKGLEVYENEPFRDKNTDMLRSWLPSVVLP